MKWVIRNQPGVVFDTREAAVAYAWSVTPPGEQRRKVDGIDGTESKRRAETQAQLTLQAFRRLGDAAEAAALELRGMMAAIEHVVPESIFVKATEGRYDMYNLVIVAARELDSPAADEPTSAE